MLGPATDIAHLHTTMGDDTDYLNRYYFEATPWVIHRMRLLREETGEALDALFERSPSAVLGEHIDVIVVALGTLISAGFTPTQINEAWERVMAANMRKVPDPKGGKWIKPPGWEKPTFDDLTIEPRLRQPPDARAAAGGSAPDRVPVDPREYGP